MTTLTNIYGNKIRIRVCGVLKKENKILLINHEQLTSDNIFWNFPGGGLEKGESIYECLKREFLEETNLEITINNFLYLNEFKKNKLHAIELYFSVSCNNIKAKLGHDPELNIISDLRWFSKEDLLNLGPLQYPNFVTQIAFN